jgi:peptidoglycan/xylan/chitin deacetylase (PgdA/CDA1 family)
VLNFSPFLLYHKIDRPPPDARIRGAYTSPRRFEGQISYLLKRGVKFTTAAELADRFLSEGRYPPRTAAITFDDGWKDNFTNAFPILKRLGVTATVFVVPRVLGLITDSVTADGEGPREHMSPSEVRRRAVDLVIKQEG